MVEAMRLGFADALKSCGDGVDTTETLSAEAAEARAVLFSADEAMSQESLERDPLRKEGPDTVYFCVVDGEGNACSFINSNYDGFGTGIVPDGCGFPLQNRGYNFNTEPGHPNCAAPRKRPYHTIMPGMVTEEGSGDLFCAGGVMGGFMQPQGHLQVFSAMADFGLSPQAALDLPRFCLQGVDSTVAGAGTLRGAAVLLEEGVPAGTAEALRAKGQNVVEGVSGWDRTVFGRGQVIRRDPKTGVLFGGTDPRSDGCALGF